MKGKYKRERRMQIMKNGFNTFDVIMVDFGEAKFNGEQAGLRPAVIIQNAMGNLHSNTTLVMPFTTSYKSLRQPTHSLFKADQKKGLSQDSVLLGECIRQISENRIVRKLGSIDDKKDRIEIKRVYDANFGAI